MIDIFSVFLFTGKRISIPTNTPRGFHVETTWKRSFPRHFNVESTWCVCRVFVQLSNMDGNVNLKVMDDNKVTIHGNSNQIISCKL